MCGLNKEVRAFNTSRATSQGNGYWTDVTPVHGPEHTSCHNVQLLAHNFLTRWCTRRASLLSVSHNQ
jgi:hypothetical protein